MQVPVQIPAVWVQTTSASFNALRAQGYPSFLSPEQQARVERIRQARLLFDGRHREYYLGEQRTQFDFARLVAGYQSIQPYITYNALKLICLKATDLLLGAPPTITIEDEVQEAALQALGDRTGLHGVLHAAALGASYEAEALVEAVVYQGEVYLQPMPADEVFPVGPLQPDGQYGQYVRYSVKNVGTEQTPIYLLRELTYGPGYIRRAVYQLEEGRRGPQVDLSAWVNGPDVAPLPPQPSQLMGTYTGPIGLGGNFAHVQPEQPNVTDPVPDQQLQPVTRTGVDRCTITWFPNELVRGRAVSDIDIAIELQDTLNAKQTQLAVVFAKHSDPILAAPAEMADDQGNARAANRMFFFREKDEVPQYVVWDAEVKAAQDDRDFTLDSLLVSTETAPVLLGIKGHSVHDVAFKTVKVQAMNSLKKAQRKSVYWANGIKRMLAVAQALECAAVPGVRYDLGPIGVDLNDGFPLDELDQANQLSILRGAGLLSLDKGVRTLYPDPATADAELAELEKENDAKQPSVFFGAPMPGNPIANQQTQAGEGSAAAAALAESGEEVSV